MLGATSRGAGDIADLACVLGCISHRKRGGEHTRIRHGHDGNKESEMYFGLNTFADVLSQSRLQGRSRMPQRLTGACMRGNHQPLAVPTPGLGLKAAAAFQPLPLRCSQQGLIATRRYVSVSCYILRYAQVRCYAIYSRFLHICLTRSCIPYRLLKPRLVRNLMERPGTPVVVVLS